MQERQEIAPLHGGHEVSLDNSLRKRHNKTYDVFFEFCLYLEIRCLDPRATNAVSAPRVDLVPVPLLMDAVAERNPVPRDAKREEANEAPRPPSPLKQDRHTWLRGRSFGLPSW